MKEELVDLCEDASINILQVNTLQSDAKMKVESKQIGSLIDCGATVYALPKRLTPATQFQPTLTMLRVWNKTIVIPLGTAVPHARISNHQRRTGIIFFLIGFSDESEEKCIQESMLRLHLRSFLSKGLL